MNKKCRYSLRRTEISIVLVMRFSLLTETGVKKDTNDGVLFQNRNAGQQEDLATGKIMQDGYLIKGGICTGKFTNFSEAFWIQTILPYSIHQSFYTLIFLRIASFIICKCQDWQQQIAKCIYLPIKRFLISKRRILYLFH